MALRHIIVEGPDGSGKTGLVAKLSHSFGYPIHERASHSRTGPVPSVDVWAHTDVATMADQPPSVYDRHPIISEPIYAALVRKEMPHGEFINPDWRKAMRARAAEHALLILCMPGLNTVTKNVLANEGDQMPGVLANIAAIYTAYQMAWDLWPGYGVHWNYTQNHTGAGYDALVASIVKLMAMSAVEPS